MWQSWIEVYKKLTQWQMDLGQGDETLKQVLDDQFHSANREFGKMVAMAATESLNNLSKIARIYRES